MSPFRWACRDQHASPHRPAALLAKVISGSVVRAWPYSLPILSDRRCNAECSGYSFNSAFVDCRWTNSRVDLAPAARFDDSQLDPEYDSRCRLRERHRGSQNGSRIDILNCSRTLCCEHGYCSGSKSNQSNFILKSFIFYC